MTNALLRLVFTLMPLLLVGCTERQGAKRVSEDPFVAAPTHTSYDVEVVFLDSSFTKAVLRADVGRMFEERQETTLSGRVRVTFYSRTGSGRAAVLTADSAVVDDRTRNMIAIGNVRVVSDSTRTTLTTSRLLWIHQTQRLRSDDKVVIVTPTETIEGSGFESDQYLKSYRISNVSGVHRP